MHSEPNKEISAWSARDFPVAREWVHLLSDTQLGGVMDAVERAKRAGHAFHQLTPDLFPLPGLEKTLREINAELHGRPGFAVISGLPVHELSYDDAMLAYAGVMCHFGMIADQTHSGAMSVDVKEAGADYSEKSRAYRTNREIQFHTDGSVLTGLLCLGEALRGGASVLVSSMSVYNEVKRRRPDLLDVLFQGSHHHRRGEEGVGEKPYSETRIPVFDTHNGLLQCTFDHKQIRWAHEAGAPFLQNEQAALDLIDEITGERELQLHMNMQLGDIQIVNNFIVLHARTDYQDGEGKKRHLVRLWVETPAGPRTGRTVRELYVRPESV